MPEIGHKLEKCNDVTIYRPDVIVNFFWRSHVSLVIFSCWSKFHVNIMTVSGVMTIFVCTGLTRNPKIGNTPSEFCPTYGDWSELGIPNYARICLIKCYWILQNVRVTTFTFSELLWENQQEEGELPPLHPD